MSSRIRRPRQALVTAAILQLARRTRYVEAEMLGLRTLIRPGSVCMDVGAAAGLYTLVLSGLAGTAGQVHSFEPVPFAHPALTRLLGARLSRNVSHHALALGAEPGRGVMSVPVSRHGPVTGRSFLDAQCDGLGSNSEFADQVRVDVDVRTLDEVCAGMSRLDFIKIDVEGAELQVLKGGAASIERFRPALLIEIEERHTSRYQHSAADVADWLAHRNYRMLSWQDGWQETDAVCGHVRNYLFLPDGQAGHIGVPAARSARRVPDSQKLAAAG